MKIDRRKVISLITGFILANIPFRLLAQTASYSSLAPKKRLTVTQKQDSPFFLGWYDYIENSSVSKRVADRGISLIMPYIEFSTTAKVQVFLDKAQTAKIKVLLEISRSLVESGNIAGVKEFIRAYKHHPAVYGWYLYDEPEIKKPQPLAPSLLTDVYRAIKAEDRSKPVAIAFYDVNNIAAYSQAMDILMWDDYPCKNGVAEFDWAPSYRSDLHKVNALASDRQKKFLNIIQAYSGHESNKRLPTKLEFRYMFYASILTGTDGLLFWMHSWSTPAWNESVLYPTIKEFRTYLPALGKGQKLKNIAPAKYSNVEIKLFPISNHQKHLLLAINHNRQPISLPLKLNRQLAGKAVTVNKHKIDRISAQSSFQVILQPYEVRLYEIS